MENHNRLGKEKSPYLLQHQNNPVHWYTWGEEALQAAKKEQKIIFLSVGYSTCYWCHVMERECFEDEEVAYVLNRDYVCIKVDREERPDIDKIYMDAVVAMIGQGGWPLNVMLTPTLQPFFGGTYFPKPQFLKLLKSIQEHWQKDQARITESADSITEALQAQKQQANAEALNEDSFRAAVTQFGESFESVFGGFSSAPKFPPATSIALLLRIYRRTEDPNVLHMITHTLDKMARGGIFDHLGGGFHRYSTDTKWLIPHFEKMLYDNALLAKTYLEAFQLTEEEMYRSVGQETLDYILDEMMDPAGGFYSAQDAGDVGREGEYYVWQEEELESALSADEFAHVKEIYGLSSVGNFENNFNVFNLQDQYEWSIKAEPLSRAAHEKIAALRKARRSPHLDDKILTSWNGLAISAMAKGFQVLGDERYLRAAERAARLIQRKLFQNGKLLRRYRDGDARYAAFLEDYAYLIAGLLDLYESNFDTKWLNWACKLQGVLDACFWDKEKLAYFYTEAGDESIIIRKKDFIDGATPSGNGVAALNLLRLYHFTYREEYQKKAKMLFSSMSAFMNRFPSALSAAFIALDFHLDSVKEVVVIESGDPALGRVFKDYLYKRFLPNKVMAFGNSGSMEDPFALSLFKGKLVIEQKTTFYVCENNSCKLPTNDVEKAKGLLEEVRGYGEGGEGRGE